MADVVLKDKKGTTGTYDGISHIRVQNSEGVFKYFSDEGWIVETTKIEGGKFTPDSTIMTINHNLGAVPDFIFVGRLDIKGTNKLQSARKIEWAYGWSKRIRSIEGFNGYGANNSARLAIEYDPEYLVDGYFSHILAGFDEPQDDMYGNIRNVNSISFTIGTTKGMASLSEGLDTRADYFWFAVSGLGTRMHQEGEV